MLRQGTTGAGSRHGRRALATIGLGYADGIPIGGSGIDGRGASVNVDGVTCPVVGRISMDLTIVDVTDVPADRVKTDAMVEWLGPHADIDVLARSCGTIGYEMLVNLGRRHRRHYIGAEANR